MTTKTKIDYSTFPWLKTSIISCVIAIIFWGGVYYPKWNNKSTEATISYDVSGYYLYLPALFIYQDLKQIDFLSKVEEKYKPAPGQGQTYLHEKSGNKILKYSLGQAIHYLPWFILGHLSASVLHDFPADGFSYPYQLAIGIGMMIYCFIGIFFLFKILSIYFSKAATAITVIALVLASNYLEYGGISNAMTHNTLFTNYCILIYLSIRFYKKPDNYLAAGIGFFVGLNALTRPTEIISFLIPLLWGVNLLSSDSIKSRASIILANYKKYLLAIAICTLIGSLQLIYWKYVSGEWVVYSYQEQGFSWLRPHLKAGILSFKTGWLIYSPIMILSLLGFPFLFARKNIFWPCFIFSFLFIYICFAWDIWWYGGSLGQRAMVQSYPILAFPLAAFIEKSVSAPRIRLLLASFLLFCISYNFWLTHQAHKGGILKPGFMTKPYFLATVLETDINCEKLKLLDTEEIFIGERKDIILSSKMTDSTFVLTNQSPFTEKLIYKEIPKNKTWVRASAVCLSQNKEWDVWAMTQLIVKFLYKSEEVKSNFIRIDRHLNSNAKKRIYMDAKIPESPYDEIQFYMWNPGSKTIEINDMKLELFN